MPVVITDNVPLGTLNAGYLRPREKAKIAEANKLSPEQVAQLSAPDLLQAMAAAGINAPNVITPNALPSAPYPFTHARILYDNVLSDATGNDLVRSPNTYERSTGTSFTLTMPSNRPIDSIGVLGVVEGATVTVQYSTTTTGSFVTVATLTPSNNRAIMVLFNQLSARRVRVTLSSSRQLINISAGIALAMERPIFGGHNPITMSRQTTYNNRRTETGNFVSRNIIRSGLSGNYEWSNLSDDWVRSQFDPFIEAARTLPFYIAWRPEDYPEEVAYAWTTGDISPSNQGVRNLMSVGMEVQAYGD